MASLQNSFHYAGDASRAPIASVVLNFDVWSYKFHAVLQDGKPLPERVPVGSHRLQVQSSLKSTEYLAPLPTEFLIGETDLSVRTFHEYYTATSPTGSATLAPFSTSLRLLVTDEVNNPFGEAKFDALYSFSTASERYADILARQRALNTSTALNEHEAGELVDELTAYSARQCFSRESPTVR